MLLLFSHCLWFNSSRNYGEYWTGFLLRRWCYCCLVIACGLTAAGTTANIGPLKAAVLSTREVMLLLVIASFCPGSAVIKLVHAQYNWVRNFNCSFTIKDRQIKKFLSLSLSDVVLIMLINVKMPLIVGILTYWSRINCLLSWVENENSFITSGLGIWSGSPCLQVSSITIFFWRRESWLLSWVEYENSFITSGPGSVVWFSLPSSF